MATLTMSHPRQPLGTLDSPRLQSLTRSKMNLVNQQNGTTTPKPAKYTTDIHMDTENIDPQNLHQSSKRKRSTDDLEESINKAPVKSSKTSRIALKTVDNPTPRTLNNIPSTPKSAPAPAPASTAFARKPAGRSPGSTAKTTKSCKPFARRTNVLKPRGEASQRKSVNGNRPFSLATALSSSTGQPKTKPQPVETPAPAPASWFFDIHIDSEEDEMTNLMQHSTTVLDITDDEGKKASIGEERGKENIPPSSELGLGGQPAAAATRQTRKQDVTSMEEARTPLEELDARGFYADGCHAFSYEVVFDDDDDGENGSGGGRKNAWASKLRESWEGEGEVE